MCLDFVGTIKNEDVSVSGVFLENQTFRHPEGKTGTGETSAASD